MFRQSSVPRAIVAFAAILASGGVLACNDSPPPTAAASDNAPGGPNFTAGSGVSPTIIARGNLGAFHVQSKHEGYQIELKAHDDTDVQVRSAIASPGSYSGWHTHPGPVILAIKTGTLTVYDATDPNCEATVYSAGTAFFEGTTPHNVRNEGTIVVEYATVYFIPKNGVTRIEAGFPPNCPP